MVETSQIAKVLASHEFCSRGKDTSEPPSQTANMAKRDGPANHLKAWRKFRGLTQEQLAERVGTSGSVISQIESSDRGLSHKWLLKLAPALGATPGFLLDHDPNDLDAAFLEAALAVPKESRQQALKILQTFKTGTEG